MEAASRNISACSLQAVSQVGCRLMVASSAKINRPRPPGRVEGERPFTWARKASMSARGDVVAGAVRPFAVSGGSFAMDRHPAALSPLHKVALPRLPRNACRIALRRVRFPEDRG